MNNIDRKLIPRNFRLKRDVAWLLVNIWKASTMLQYRTGVKMNGWNGGIKRERGKRLVLT